MFHNISSEILQRMKYLEEIDTRDRNDGTSRMRRLRQIAPETGRFLAIIAASSPNGKMIEIGTSAGYSALWLSLVCSELNRKLTTFEILDDKYILAKETFKKADVEDVIELIQGDALEYLDDYHDISFCFLDAEKDVYEDCYEKVIPLMSSGGILVADNAISHQKDLKPWINKVIADSRVDALVVPIGKGELVCRKR